MGNSSWVAHGIFNRRYGYYAASFWGTASLQVALLVIWLCNTNCHKESLLVTGPFFSISDICSRLVTFLKLFIVRCDTLVCVCYPFCHFGSQINMHLKWACPWNYRTAVYGQLAFTMMFPRSNFNNYCNTYDNLRKVNISFPMTLDADNVQNHPNIYNLTQMSKPFWGVNKITGINKYCTLQCMADT